MACRSDSEPQRQDWPQNWRIVIVSGIHELRKIWIFEQGKLTKHIPRAFPQPVHAAPPKGLP
jgi:hypothetical protein